MKKMFSEMIKAYNYLLDMVNRQIHLCLYTKNHFEEEIKANIKSGFDLKFDKEIVKRNKIRLKELKEIKRFLIEEKRSIKSFLNFLR